MTSHPVLRALALLLLAASRLAAQAPTPPDSSWNSPRALELIRRAQARRAGTIADTGLVNYQADARLFVYFYLDRPGSEARNLVKTDQLALDVLWEAPNRVKQRIVGWRDEKSLPTNIHYHLDHLTVVQENFGNEIRIGDGDEVRGVLHPAAPGADSFYEYRLADSLTLRLPGADDPVRVYQLRVRPRNQDAPAFVGSVFVERRAGDLVRMDFTFTRAAYIDRALDYINISLDNGLWSGRYWLPNEQRVEIRREVRELDFPLGSVIRGSMRVGNYRFNQPLPPGTFAGPRVVAAPRAQREAFPFEEEIHAEVREEGIGPAVELGEVRRLAAELVRRRALQRVSGARLGAARVSDVLRYDRAEGLALGAGVSAMPATGTRLLLRGGFAFGAEHPFASLDAAREAGANGLSASLFLHRVGDVGVGPVISPTANTLTSFVAGRDYTDPFYRGGLSLAATHALTPAWTLGVEASLERQRSATRGGDFSLGGDLRGVRPVDRLDEVAATLQLSRRAPAELGRWWTAELRLRSGLFDPAVRCGADPRCLDVGGTSFLKPTLGLGWGRRWVPASAELAVTARAGGALGHLPLQELYLVGGRGTAPGYGFRAYGGDRFAAADVTLQADLWRAWLRGRVFGAAGWAGVGPAGRTSLARWGAEPSGRLLPSLGIGVGLISDILRLDLARGLARGGRWELILEANPSFRDFL